MTANVIIQVRRDEAANWTSDNPVLHDGEIGYEKDTGHAKIGDGSTAWNSLGYWAPSADSDSGGGAIASVFGRTTSAIVAATGDYSVGQVTGAAPLASPAFSGTPTAPTPSAGDASTKVGTTAYTDAAVLVEKNRAVGVESGLAAKASPAFTGTPTAPTPSALDNSTKVGTTAYTDLAVGVETSRAVSAETSLSARLIRVDSYGADPTGATYSDTAFAAAQTAGGTSAYQIVMGTGTYKLAGSYTFGRNQGLDGQGRGVTRINYTGSGTCVSAYDASFSSSLSYGGRMSGFTMDGSSAGSAATGLSWGNLLLGRGSDIRIQNFTGATATGLVFRNGSSSAWSEEAEWTAINLNNNTVNVLFDTGSFDYSTYQFVIEGQANQDGIRLQNGASIEGCRVELRGNFFSAAGNTGAVFALDRNATGTGSSRIDKAQIYVNVECDGSTGLGHFTVLMLGGSSSQFNGVGVLVFANGTVPFQGGTFTTQFGFIGTLSEVSLGSMTPGDAGVVHGGLLWSVRGSLTSNTSAQIYLQGGDIQAFQLSSGATALAFAGGTLSQARRIEIFIAQPASGSAGTITWPGNVTWASGLTPVLQTANGAVDRVRLTYLPSAATWYGEYIGGGQIDKTASDIQAIGTQAAGSSGLHADARHVHPSTGLLLSANNLSELNASAATVRSNLGLGSAAVQNTSYFDLAGAASNAQANAIAASLSVNGGTLLGALAVQGPVVSVPYTLTPAASVVVNAASSSVFRLPLNQNSTLATPSNPSDGQEIAVWAIQPATGGPYTLGYSAAYSFPATCPQPSLSIAASSRDLIQFRYDSAVSLWVCTGYILAQSSPLVTIAQGGTGATSQQAAITALTGLQTSGYYLRSNGTNAILSALQVADLPTSAATAGAYTNANITIDAYGRVTVAANGTGGGVTLDSTATDIQPTGNQAAGVNTKAAAADHVHPSPGAPGPADYGWVAWSVDPFPLNAAVTIAAGTIYFLQFPVHYTRTLTNIILHLTTAGATLTTAENFVGIYNSAGTQVAVSADQTTVFGTTGVKTIAMTTPYSAPPGLYWAAILANGTTGPTIRSASAAASSSWTANAGLAASALRIAVAGTAQTTLPGTVTPSALVQTSAMSICVIVS